MQYLKVDYKNLNIKEEICLSIGNFDGIHKGHNKILEKLKKKPVHLMPNLLSFPLILIPSFILITL